MFIQKGKVDIPSTVPPEASDLIKKALVTNPNFRISAADFLQHPWFSKNGLFQKQEQVFNSPVMKSLEDSHGKSRIQIPKKSDGYNPLLTHFGSRSVSREPQKNKENEQTPPTIHPHSYIRHVKHEDQPHPPAHPHPSFASPNAQTINPSNFVYKPTQPITQMNSPILQNSSPNEYRPLQLDYTIQHPTFDNSLQTPHNESRLNNSGEVSSTEMSKIRRTPPLQLKTASKLNTSNHDGNNASIHNNYNSANANTYTSNRHHSPAPVIRDHHTPPPAFNNQNNMNSNSGNRIVLTGKPVDKNAEGKLLLTPNKHLNENQPERIWYGERGTPIKDAIIGARDHSPPPTKPHGHFMREASPGTSGISVSKEGYRPLLNMSDMEIQRTGSNNHTVK